MLFPDDPEAHRATCLIAGNGGIESVRKVSLYSCRSNSSLSGVGPTADAMSRSGCSYNHLVSDTMSPASHPGLYTLVMDSDSPVLEPFPDAHIVVPESRYTLLAVLAV